MTNAFTEVQKLFENGMVSYVNVTAHALTFQTLEGEVFNVPPSGIIINARPVEVSAGTHPAGVELVRTAFQPEEMGEIALNEIYKVNPAAIVIGSIIAAQAYPGRVLSMVPVSGFERVAPAEKRMMANKFTSF